jgi:Fe-S-cluster-containing dehydrogenase component
MAMVAVMFAGMFAATLLFPVTGSLNAVAEEGASATTGPSLQERVEGHRPLRGNPPPAEAAPAEPQSFAGYPTAPAFTVQSREGQLNYFPCEDCHSAMPSNPQRRRLYAPHPAALNHGDGRFWCLDCHAAENRNLLVTSAGDEVGFDDAYLVCGQCHYPRRRTGISARMASALPTGRANEKSTTARIATTRMTPSVKARAPEPPPPVRRGLAAMPVHQHESAEQRRSGDGQVSDDTMKRHEHKVDETGFDAYRRRFLRNAVKAAAGCRHAGCGVARPGVAPASCRCHGQLFPGSLPAHEPEEISDALGRIERRAKRDYGVDIVCEDTPPQEDVVFGYALNISKCQGYRDCVSACVRENNQGRDSQMQYIRVLEMEQGTRNLEHSEHYYDPETVPVEGKYYMPVQCMQCDNPPCVKACPVEATWMEPDGIVVVDYDWCIGCRYCMTACPYWARHFNWNEPEIPARGDQSEYQLPGQPAAAARCRREVPLLHAAHARRDASPPARKPARRGRGSSATCSIRTARSATCWRTRPCSA